METIARDRVSWPRRAPLVLLDGYRCFVSPWLPPSCRFVPSCSVYASEAIARYGVAMGIWLGLRRLLRCHPGSPGGNDPVR